MMCHSPITIRNPKLNKGFFDPLFVTIPCGKCSACLSTRITDWTNRIKDEMRNNYYSSGYFVTLTYSDRPLHGVDKKHVQDFFKRLRHELSSFKYYCIAEYGPRTYRPHYHLILLCLDDENKVYDSIEKCWSLGFVEVSAVTEQRIRYVTSYHATKNSLLDFDYPDIDTGELIPQNKVFVLMSKKLGFSQLQFDKMVHRFDKVFISRNGVRYHMPKYYKDKLFTDYDKRNCREYFATRTLIDDDNADDILNQYKRYEHFNNWFKDNVVLKKKHKERRC